jgi:hypothetical protein
VLGRRWFRDGTSLDVLACDHWNSRAAGYWYVDEVTAALADKTPEL